MHYALSPAGSRTPAKHQTNTGEASDSSQNVKERKLWRGKATQGGLLGTNMNGKLVHALASTFEALKQRRGEKCCEVI